MKHIVVIAGNQVLFEDYVKKVKFLKTNLINLGNQFIVEGVTFMLVKDSYQLRGYTFSHDSELVEIDSRFPEAVRNDIRQQFKARRER